MDASLFEGLVGDRAFASALEVVDCLLRLTTYRWDERCGSVEGWCLGGESVDAVDELPALLHVAGEEAVHQRDAEYGGIV